MQFRCNQTSQNLTGTKYGPDSLYVPNFVETNLQMQSSDLFETFLNYNGWVDENGSYIAYRGNPLNRVKCFFTENVAADPETGIPTVVKKYVYPGWQYRISLRHRCFRELPTLDKLVQHLSNHFEYCAGATWLKMRINHAIGTQYRDSNDYIGFHQDKTETITDGTPILMLSFGERREMHLTDLQGNVKSVVVMEPGSLFVLGPQTNATMKHAIVVGKDERVLDKNRIIGPRVSLVLRDISTSVSAKEMLEMIPKSLRQAAKGSGVKLECRTANTFREIMELDSAYEEALQRIKAEPTCKKIKII